MALPRAVAVPVQPERGAAVARARFPPRPSFRSRDWACQRSVHASVKTPATEGARPGPAGPAQSSQQDPQHQSPVQLVQSSMEGPVNRRLPHAARSLSWFASPLTSHPGLRAVRHALCCVASHGCAMGECVGSAFHAAVSSVRCAFLLAVTLDRRLTCSSDSAAPCSRVPKWMIRLLHEWRRLHIAIHT